MPNTVTITAKEYEALQAALRVVTVERDLLITTSAWRVEVVRSWMTGQCLNHGNALLLRNFAVGE